MTVALLLANHRDARAQTPEARATPASWTQLRGGTDNRGSLPGSLMTTWRFKSPRPVRGMAVAGGLVLIGTESADADAALATFADDQRGFLTALDAVTGRELWSRPVPSWIHGDPVVYRGRVVATFGRWPMTYPGGIAALDARTGRVLWSFAAPAGMMPGPAIDTSSNTVFAAGGDGILYSFDLATGEVQHQSGLTSADGMSSPHIDSRQVLYVGAAGTLSSYSATNSELLWSYRPRTYRDLGDVPVALSDSIVFTTGMTTVGFWTAARRLPLRRFIQLAREAHRTRPLSSYQGWFNQQWLLAVHRGDGRLLWQAPLGVGLEVPRNTSGTPVLAWDRVIVSSPVSKTVWTFDKSSGKMLWNYQLEAIHKGAVTVVDDDILAGDKSGVLTLLAVANGRLIGRCRAKAAFTPLAPIVVGGTLLAATRDGWVYATPYATLRQKVSSERTIPCF